MISSKSVIIVSPGCPPELIQELIGSRILPPSTDLAVLLPPEKTRQYDQFIEEKNFYGVRFLRSPGRRFFSTPHLKWLRGKLRSSENAVVLITKSPYHDLNIAIISLLILLLTGKTINLLRANQVAVNSIPESVIDIKCQAQRWINKELNFKILCNEIFYPLHRFFLYWRVPRSPWNIWEILYFLMFAGLAIRRSLSIFFSSLSHKLRGT